MCNDSRLIIASFEHYWNHCYCLSSTLSAAWVCTHAHKAHTHRHSPSYTCSEAVGSEFSICQHNHLVYLHIMVFSSTIWRNGSHEAKIKPTCTWMGIAPLLAETETRGSSEANLQSSNLKWVLIESIPKEHNLYITCTEVQGTWWWVILPCGLQDGYQAAGILKLLFLWERKQTNQ